MAMALVQCVGPEFHDDDDDSHEQCALLWNDGIFPSANFESLHVSLFTDSSPLELDIN